MFNIGRLLIMKYINVSTSINVNGVDKIDLYAVCFETEPLDESVIQTLVFNKRGLPEAKYSVVEMTMQGPIYICNVLQMYDDINNQNLKNITSSDSPFVYIVTITTDGSTALNGTMKTVTLVDKNLSLSNYYDTSLYDIMIHVDSQNMDGYELDAATGDVTKVFDLSQNVQAPYEASVVGKGPRIAYTHDPMTLTTDINGHNTFHGFAQFGLVPASVYSGFIGEYNSGHVMKKNMSNSFTIVFVVQFDVTLGTNWSGILTYYVQNGIRGLCLTRYGGQDRITVGSGTRINTNSFNDVLSKHKKTPLVIVSRFENKSTDATYRFNQYLKVVEINTRTVLHQSYQYHDSNYFDHVFKANGGPLFIGCDEFMYDVRFANIALPNLKWGEVLMYNEFLEDSKVDELIHLLVNKWN